MQESEVDFRWLDDATLLVAEVDSEPHDWLEVGFCGNIEFQNRLRVEDRQRWFTERDLLV